MLKRALEGLPWESGGPGLRFKRLVLGQSQLRLAEFSEGFEEAEGCRKGHQGLVLEGQAGLEYQGQSIWLRKNDAFILPAGAEHQHKLVLKKGERIVLLLFDDASQTSPHKIPGV
jgi:hypothetical protein